VYLCVSRAFHVCGDTPINKSRSVGLHDSYCAMTKYLTFVVRK